MVVFQPGTYFTAVFFICKVGSVEEPPLDSSSFWELRLVISLTSWKSNIHPSESSPELTKNARAVKESRMRQVRLVYGRPQPSGGRLAA
jgi:hypothetical protein